jgi:chitodextrinase
MRIARTLLLRAVGAASLALLALPVAAAANPGTGPELVQRSGQFVILHADERDGGSTRQWMLVNGLEYTPLRAPRDVWIDPGSRVRLEGTMQNGALVLGSTLTAVRELSPSPNASDTSQTPSTETTAVVMFYFSNQTASSMPTVSTADATMTTDPKSLRAYYLEQTYGQVTFETTVFAPVKLAEPAPSTGDCLDSIDSWAQEAEGLTAGFDQSQYRHIVYAFPALPQSVCGWSGLAEVGGRHVWTNGSLTVPVLAHELGHNLGLYHAGGLTCTASGAPAPMGDTCSIDRQHYYAAGVLPQYADPFDAMGNAPVLRQMNMEHKLALGVLPATAVATVGISGTYSLAPMETLTGSVELLRLPKPGGGNYFVEYRRPIGVFDLQAGPSVTGVLVHTESPDMADPFSDDYRDSDTALVDMHPDGAFTSAQWQNAAMSVNQVFSDPLHGITIQNLAQDVNGATLAITMPVDTTPPGRPGRLSAVVSGTSVSLQWTEASDDFAVDSYRVARDGTQIGSLATTSFMDTGLAPGSTVTYAVTAVDTAGNVGAASTIGVAIPDSVPPSVPTNVSAKVARDGTVHISWGASTDNNAVASYRVLRSGTGIIQANVTAYVDKTPRSGTGATVTYSVVAFDMVGNASAPGAAKPLRAALLRPLGASHLKAKRAKGSSRVRVQGTLSDVKAICRMRLGHAKWRSCGVKASGAFSANLRGKGATRVTLSLRDELGRTKQLTLRVR